MKRSIINITFFFNYIIEYDSEKNRYSAKQ